MNRYAVTMVFAGTMVVEVEASNQQEAVRKAEQIADRDGVNAEYVTSVEFSPEITVDEIAS